MSFLDGFFRRKEIMTLDISAPKMRADYESNAPTGVSLNDIQGMEQFLIGIKTHTGQVVTPMKAMRCATVLACLRILSEDLSALRLPIYKRTSEGVMEAPNHPLYTLLDVAPNAIMTSMELREHILFDLMLNGNFYVLINGETEIESLWPLQAGYVTRRWRELVWVFTDPLTGISGQFVPENAWRGTILSGNGIDGQAITMLAREAIGLLLAAEEQGARLFKNGVQTDFTLQTDGEMDPTAKDALRESFMKRHSGAGNAFMPLLLENGLKANRIGLTAVESQYIEARRYQVEDIARVFRIPEVLLGSSTSGKSSTYASAEQFFQSYTKHTLNPWTVRIEQTMNRDLLSIKERSKYFFRHDFSSLLRGDTAARYASYATGIDKGFITPGYAAKQENLPWKPELEYYNKPQQAAPGANQQEDAKPAPTDQSGERDGLPFRVAEHILGKEHKALIGGKQDADVFYANFGGFVEDLTGADLDGVLGYIEMRRTTADKFSTESREKALAALRGLCKRTR